MRSLDHDLWCIDHDLKQGPGVRIGTRTTIVRLPDGGLWVHSPGPLDEAITAEVAGLGPVRALVAPNLLHHLFVADWQRAFPEARTFAVPGLEKKRPNLRVDELLGDVAPEGWAGTLDLIVARGVPTIAEVVFRHRPTRTLILGDLAFNVRRGDWSTRAIMTLNGAFGRFGPSRALRFGMVADKAALRETLATILSWEFDRVIVCHGDVLDTGGPEALLSGYAWL